MRRPVPDDLLMPGRYRVYRLHLRGGQLVRREYLATYVLDNHVFRVEDAPSGCFLGVIPRGKPTSSSGRHVWLVCSHSTFYEVVRCVDRGTLRLVEGGRASSSTAPDAPSEATT